MSELGGPDPAAERLAGRRFRLGPPRVWATVLGALAVLSFAAMIPLTLVSH